MKICVNKWKVACMAAICLLFLVSVCPRTAIAEENDFEIKDGVLVKYSGTDENVVIPDYVTKIGESAFSNCTTMKQIAIPNSVTTIEKQAFNACSVLTRVIIPDSVTKIGENTFNNCIALTEVTLPSSMKRIPSGMFFSCTALTKVYLPGGVTSIGSYAFARCSSLETIFLPNTLTTIGECAFQLSGIQSLTIPKSVSNFGQKIIDGTPWLQDMQKQSPMIIINNILVDGTKCKGKVNIPNTVTSIAARAFAETSITSITMGDQVTTVGAETFYKCKKLTKVVLSNNIERLEYNTFSGCKKLKRINFPKNLKYIGEFCFDTCISLPAKITLPNGLTTLGSECFKDCSSITDIVFPKTISEIKEYPFKGTAWDDNQNGDFVIINQILCRVAKYNLREHSGSMVIPNTIKKIAPYAFQNSRMTSIIIPKSVVKIGFGAFINTIFLESITIPSSTVLEDELFKNSGDELLIYSANNSKAKKYAIDKGIRFEAIGFNQTEYAVVSGKTLKLALNCLANCSWSSSDPAVASVNAKGIVTAKSQGSVLITAKLYGRKYTCTVTVQ